MYPLGESYVIFHAEFCGPPTNALNVSSRSGFFVDGDAPQRDEVCAAVAALKRAAEQFGEHRIQESFVLCACTS